jgi:sulfatase modifying factor 1
MLPPPGSSRVRLALVLALGAGVGCRPDTTPTDDQQQLVTAFGGDRGQACKYVSSLSRPYVVAWDEIKLNDLQRAIDKGQPLAVRYEGCELELLTKCTAAGGRYQFSRASMTRPQVVVLRSANQAIAEFQIGGVELEAHFDSYDVLEVTRALGGTWDLVERQDFFDDEFSGSRCEGATHVVHAVDVGAYRVDGSRGKAGGAKVGGGVAGAKAAAGGSGSASRSELSHKGDPQQCEASGWGQAPTAECSTPLRLTLEPIRPAAERDSVCPYGMQHVAGGRLGQFPLLEFCIDATEVTAQAYAECVDAGACDAPSRSRLGTWREAGKERHPVTDVTWYDATRYCEHVGRRLPTAEEWEWAARGRDEERPFPWGTLAPTSDLACWNRADAGLGTCATGEHPLGQSRDGVLDLAGNVAEWTASPFEGNERRRAVMGGSWRDEVGARLQTSTRRGHKARDEGNGDVGFRCAAAVRPLERGRGQMI